MQEKFTDKHPARAYFESLSQLDQIQAMQIVAEFEESEMRQRRRYAALMEQRKEEVLMCALCKISRCTTVARNTHTHTHTHTPGGAGCAAARGARAARTPS